MDYGYSRTSTGDQDALGQTHKIRETGVPANRVFLDRGVSGLKPAMERPEFSALYKLLVPGDVLTVPDLSRLGRDVIDVLIVARELDTAGIGLVILSVGGAVIDTRTALGKFFLQVMAAIAELVRNQIAENTKMKLDALKAQGTYPATSNPNRKAREGDPVVLGRPSSITPEKIEAAKRMKASGMKVPEIAEILGTRPSTLYARMAAAEN
jgi:putative DNA-invertase from lambdoid prophage Rac